MYTLNTRVKIKLRLTSPFMLLESTVVIIFFFSLVKIQIFQKLIFKVEEALGSFMAVR